MCARAFAERGVIVDNFHARDMPKGSHYFLTHLHNDHMSGLSAKWHAAPMHVSELTLALMAVRYGADSRVVQNATGWKPRTWRTLKILDERVRVLCLPAEHCAGSVMWLFKFADGTNAVFTGDFRLTPELLRWKGWRRMQPVTKLLYDSSFDDDDVKIPSVEQAVDALQSVFERLHVTQRMAVMIHTGGTEMLVAKFCARYGHTWHVDDSTKQADEVRIGLRDLAPDGQCRRPNRNTVWCVGEKFRRAHAGDRRWVYVRPSAVWFMCHAARLERRDTYTFGDAVPDRTNTFRVFYSTHASHAECRELIDHLAPEEAVPCVEPIAPGQCIGSVKPNWKYHEQLDSGKPLRTFKTQSTINS